MSEMIDASSIFKVPVPDALKVAKAVLLRWKMMSREELKNYLNAQLREIEKYKWIESERERRDIGFQRAAFEWIALYGEQFHRQWVAQDGKRQAV